MLPIWNTPSGLILEVTLASSSPYGKLSFQNASTITVTDGALPNGITILGDGTISGILSDNDGVYTFTLTLTNPDGTADRTFSIQVNQSLPTWITPSGNIATITSTIIPNPLIQVIVQNITGLSLIGYLPTGLFLTQDGIIYGEVNAFTQSKVYDFTIRAINQNGYSDRQFRITLQGATLKWDTLSGQVGEFKPNQTIIPITLQYQNAISAIITDGALPTGLLFQNGLISGTINPNASIDNYIFTITLYDAAGNTLSRTFNIMLSMESPVWLTPYGNIATIPADLPYSQNVFQLAYTPSNAKILQISGTLPSGFSINNSGMIISAHNLPTDTPRMIYPFTARLDNGIGIADRDFSITILAPVGGWTTNSPITRYFPYEQISRNYHLTETVIIQMEAIDPNGIIPSYTIKNGQIPNGLTLTSTGLLYGLLITEGTFTFTLTANGSVAQDKTFIMTVDASGNTAPKWLTSPGWIGNIKKGVAFSFTLKGQDLENNVRFILDPSAQVPPGFSMIPGQEIPNGIITGTLTSDAITDYPFDIRLTDNQLSVTQSFYLAANVVTNNTTTIKWSSTW